MNQHIPANRTLADRLAREIEGEVLFDRFTRGLYSTDASIYQFEQHIRAIAGWPLGKTVRNGEVTMTNLIGDDILSYEQWLTVPGATVHLYGKGAPRPGRKMGHVTEVSPASKK